MSPSTDSRPVRTPYEDFLRHVQQHGTPKSDRTGTGTLSVFGHQMRFDLREGFPLITTKKVHFRSVALELLCYLQKHYAQNLEDRYKLGWGVEKIAAAHDDELLEAIGRKRGAVMSGGRVNTQKAAELVLTDFRTHILGRITLETPAEFVQWVAAGEAAELQRQALAEAKKKQRKAGRR